MNKIVPQITRGDTKFVIHVSEKLAFEDSCRNINYDDPHLNLMQEEEFKEIHLSHALEKRSSIPTPDVIEIDEQIYDKLYPPKASKGQKHRVFAILERDDLCDYDMDSTDIAWMQKQPKHWKLSTEMFEKIIEWLENECSNERNVPSLEALLSQPFVKDLYFIISESVYDYWLERRLVGKRKLMFRVKQENAQRKRKKNNYEDPYVAFRVCQEKMHTRKNRSADQENYVKMLRWRKEISNWLKFGEKLRQRETKKFQAEKLKLAVFEEQFRSQNFIEPHMTCSVKFSDYGIQRDFLDLDKTDESEEDDIEEAPMEVEKENEFEFITKEGCQYHAPVSEDSGFGWSDASDEPVRKFQRTTEGIRRKRIGRGGRIIFDRREHHLSDLTPEYRRIDCAPTIKINSFQPLTSFSQNPVALMVTHLKQVPESLFMFETVIRFPEKAQNKNSIL